MIDVAATYSLRPAAAEDEAWVEALRRSVYHDLMVRTFGAWDEPRHARHHAACWARGNILVVEVDGHRVGMIQLHETSGTVVIHEIQMRPSEQRRGLGTRLVRDTQARAHASGRSVQLSVALKNDGALRLYSRLGFDEVGRTDSHRQLESRPPR